MNEMIFEFVEEEQCIKGVKKVNNTSELQLHDHESIGMKIFSQIFTFWGKISGFFCNFFFFASKIF